MGQTQNRAKLNMPTRAHTHTSIHSLSHTHTLTPTVRNSLHNNMTDQFENKDNKKDEEKSHNFLCVSATTEKQRGENKSTSTARNKPSFKKRIQASESGRH